MAPLRQLLQKLFPQLVWVPSLANGGGIKARAAGALDLAVSARPISDAERATGLVATEVFRTPLVWAVNASVKVRNTTPAELTDLYSGKLAHWPDGQPVRPILRPEQDSDTVLARSLGANMVSALAAAALRPGMKISVTDNSAAAEVERIPGAIGTAALGLLLAQGRQVSALALDGVAPGTASQASGQYPLRKSIYLLTRASPPPQVLAVQQGLAGRSLAQSLAQLGCLAVDTR